MKEQILFKLAKEEKELFTDFAKAVGMSVSALIRSAVFEKIASTPQAVLDVRNKSFGGKQ